MDSKFFEERIAYQNSNPSSVSRYEERRAERELKEQDELQKKEEEEKQRQREEFFGKIFESI